MTYPRLKLGSLCDLVYGDGLPEGQRAGGRFPVYGSNGIVGWHDRAITCGPTVVIGRKGSVGEVHYSALPCWPIDTTYFVERTKKACELTWLYYMLLALDLRQLNKAAAVPGLNRDDAYERELYYPPLPDQRRIAGILAKADRMRRLRRYASELSEGYLEAVFGEMFGDSVRDLRGWGKRTLSELGTRFTYGTSAKCYGEAKGLPVLRIPNVLGGQIGLDDLKFAVLPPSEAARLSLAPGDLIFVRTNGNPAYVGRCAIFDLAGTYLFASYLIRARLKPQAVHPQFLAAYLRTDAGRQAMLPYIRTTAGQSNIGIEGHRR